MGQISWKKSFENEIHIVIENWVRNILRDGQKPELHICILLVLEKIPASKNNDYSNKPKNLKAVIRDGKQTNKKRGSSEQLV